MTDYRTRLEHAALQLFATGRYPTHAMAIREATIFLSTFDTSCPPPTREWRDHRDGINAPVPYGTWVDVQYADGTMKHNLLSQNVRWDTAIVPLRPVKWRLSK